MGDGVDCRDGHDADWCNDKGCPLWFLSLHGAPVGDGGMSVGVPSHLTTVPEGGGYTAPVERVGPGAGGTPRPALLKVHCRGKTVRVPSGM